MKRTYIRPALEVLHTATADIIATSITISESTTVTDPDEAAVKDGDWGDIWD